MSELITIQGVTLTPQSAATRAKLIKIAESLFAEHGIERVSLQQINLSAGQRNKNATNYHFGDKRGLLMAILEKHQPVVVRRREELLVQLDASNEHASRGIVRALLYPMAEKLFDADGGREYLRIAAELSFSYAAVVNGLQVDLLDIGPLDRLLAARKRLMKHLPEPIAQQRVRFVVSLILNGLADHSKVLDAGEEGPYADTELAIRNLEDCLVAACDAPVSSSCTDALKRARRVPDSPPRSRRRVRRSA